MRILVLLFVILRAGMLFAIGCEQPEGALRSFAKTHGITLREQEGELDSKICKITVLDAGGKVWNEYEASLAELLGPFQVDGQPAVVLDLYSSGAHCCWTYVVLSLGAERRELHQFETASGGRFAQAPNGRLVYEGRDGNFDYFDDLCHACTYGPPLCLLIDSKGEHLNLPAMRVMAQDDINGALQRLNHPDEDLTGFLYAANQEQLDAHKQEAEATVLALVLGRLYSGDREGWADLQRLWPRWDYERIHKLILATMDARVRKLVTH